MEREAILESLAQIGAALHKQFEDKVGTHAARLEQVDHALANLSSWASYLFDEEAREVDLAVRVMNDEATSPVGGRTKKDHYAVVAGRAR